MLPLINNIATPKTEQMEYYTYAYLREDGTPYYIGKGKGDRAFNKKKKEIIIPPKQRILFLKTNLTEEEAFKHEIYMIAVFGRKDIGTGILRNLTNGGEGPSGHKHSKEHKNKISLKLKGIKGKPHSEETKRKLSELVRGSNNPNYGKTPSDETRKKISEKNKGKTVSEETRKKISEALKGKKRKPFTNETKRKMSERQIGEKNHNYGKSPSDETKRKMSEKIKGRHWWNNGQICKHCVECPGPEWKLGRITKKRGGDYFGDDGLF